MASEELATLVFAITMSGNLVHLEALEAPKWTLCGYDASPVPEWWPFDSRTCIRCERRKARMIEAGYEVQGP